MNIGLLLILNFITVPFMNEAEKLGAQHKKIPSISDIFKLKNTRKERWLILYAVFVSIFILIAISPSRSGKEYPVTWSHIATIFIFQIICWGFIIFRIKKNKQSAHSE